MEFDNSVSLTTDRVLNITSELGPEEFAAKVLAAIPSDVKSGNLGCGRILADYSIMIQTRYVLCDIYEEGPENLEDSDQPIGKNAESAAITDKVNAAVQTTACFASLLIIMSVLYFCPFKLPESPAP